MSNRQHIKRRPGDYQTHLVDLYRAGRIPAIPGALGVVDILHDPDCKRPDGGPCSCIADVGSLTYPVIREDPADG
jgi:hypothetical protein